MTNDTTTDFDQIVQHGTPVSEEFDETHQGGEVPELYCPGCLNKFGIKVPAVFARRDDSEYYSVVCPVAGLHTHDSGYISHGGPHGDAVGEDGHRYHIDRNGLVQLGETCKVNGKRVPLWRRYAALWERKWRVATAERPRMGNATRAPETAIVIDDFDWSWFDEENRLKGRVR